jgi:hypothetical protein
MERLCLKVRTCFKTGENAHIFVVVSDFGFARKMEKETNMLASVLGTPLYMVSEVLTFKYLYIYSLEGPRNSAQNLL